MQLPKLISLLKENSIDIAHTHTRVAQVLMAAAAFFVKVPYVSTAHMFYKRRLGRRLFPCWGKAVMAISETMRQGLLDIFGSQNLPPVTVVRNGIDVEKLRAKIEKVDRDAVRKAYGFSGSEMVALALSRLIPVKGVHILIEAFAKAAERVPGLRLLIAGSGDELYVQKLKNQVSLYKIEKIVTFLGNVTETEKPFKAADIFVGPYLWPEAFGLSILEALVAGLPVIGSNSGGITELLDNGKRGLLFEEGNVSELADCLLRYSKDPDLRARMGDAGRIAAADYSSKKMCGQTQSVYESVIQKR